MLNYQINTSNKRTPMMLRIRPGKCLIGVTPGRGESPTAGFLILLCLGQRGAVPGATTTQLTKEPAETGITTRLQLLR